MVGWSEPAIETHGLTKHYGRGRGIFDLDLSVEVGEVFGFMGPNGASKTTTIRLLMDFTRPDGGHARLLGLDSIRNAVGLGVGGTPGFRLAIAAAYSDEVSLAFGKFPLQAQRPHHD